MIPIDSENAQSQESMTFDCLTDANGEAGIFSEIPYEIDLPRDFVEEHLTLLQNGVSTLCIPGGRALRFPNSTLPDQIVFPRGSEIRLIHNYLGLGNRSILVVRISGTTESPEESVEQLAGAVFGLGSQALENSMRAQYRRCSFSRIDFTPASGFDGLYHGVVDTQLGYSLQGVSVNRVVSDAMKSVSGLFGMDSLEENFDHVMYCVARGTTRVGDGAEWLAFAFVLHPRSYYNSNRCASLSVLMHEIGHNLGLTHSSTGYNDYGEDTTGMVSYPFATFFCLAVTISSTTDPMQLLRWPL